MNELLPNWYRIIKTSPGKDAEYFGIRREQTTYSFDIAAIERINVGTNNNSILRRIHIR